MKKAFVNGKACLVDEIIFSPDQIVIKGMSDAEGRDLARAYVDRVMAQNVGKLVDKTLSAAGKVEMRDFTPEEQIELDQITSQLDLIEERKEGIIDNLILREALGKN